MIYVNLMDEILNKININVDKVEIRKNLVAYTRTQQDNLYSDVIGFSFFRFIGDSEKYWKKVEECFVNWIEQKLLETSSSIQPYLVFLVDKNKYIEMLDLVIKIERDELNCRKYVLPASNDLLEDWIYRLPFTELPLNRIFNTLPIMASKLLRHYGASNDLSDLLVKYRFASNDLENINKYLRNTVFGNIGLTTFDDRTTLKPKEVKLKTLKVNGFRPYVEEQVFNLDADLIVLAGPNGLGKTSVFDAIDFAVTGSIRRLDSSKDEVSPIINLNCNECNVELQFTVKEREKLSTHTIKRVISGNMQLFLDETQKRDRREILKMITQTNSPESVERLIRLFRASHLINQFDAELTHSLWEDSTLEKETVGRMLSLEDYVQAENRCDELYKEISKESKSHEDKILEIKIELKKIDEDINILNPASDFQQIGSGNNVFLQRVDMICNDLLKNKIISEKSDQITRPILRGYTALINGKIVDIEKRLKDFRSFRNSVLNMKSRQIELAEFELQKRKVLVDIDKSKNDLNLVMDQQVVNNNKLENVRNELVGLKTSLEHYRESQITIKTNQDLQNDMVLLNKEIENIKRGIASIDNFIVELEKQSKLLEININERNTISRDIKNNIQKLRTYNELSLSITTKNNLFGMNQIKASHLNIQIKERKDKILNHNAELINLELNIKILETNISNEVGKFDRLKTLIQSIKEYVISENCPLCGSPHKSKEILIEEIDKHIGDFPLNLSNDMNRLKGLKELLQKTKSEAVTEEKELEKLEFELAQVEKENEEISYTVLDIKTKINNLDLTHEMISDKAIDVLICEHQLKIDDLDKYNQGLFEQSQRIAKELTENRANKEISLAKLGKDKTRYEQLHDIISDNESRLNKIKGALPLDAGETFIMETERCITEKTAEESLLFNKSEELKNQLDSVKPLLGQNQNALQKLESEISEVSKFSDSVKIEAGKYGFPENVSLDDVDKQIISNDDLIRTLNEISHKVISAEASLDTLDRSNRLNQLNQIKTEKKQQLSRIEEAIKENHRTQGVIESFKSVLLNERNSALNRYCEATQPLAAMIQRRLRPIYGFSDLELMPSDKGEIDVTIKWYNQISRVSDLNLAPYKYLSEAQMNAVGLSIFLSSALTQTWSGLKTIMMDDPVQHFDDLNCYAFLDLIRSLIIYSNNEERPQFIISTCDNRLIRLMRQKFFPLEKQGRVKYYYFKSMGNSGPIID